MTNSRKVMDRLENKKCLFTNRYRRKISDNLEVIFIINNSLKKICTISIPSDPPNKKKIFMDKLRVSCRVESAQNKRDLSGRDQE